MLSETRHGKLAERGGIQMAWSMFIRQALALDLLLQSHERVNQSLGSRRTARNVNVHRDVAIDPLENIVALLEWSARNSAGAHRDHILRLRHLVVQAHDLRSHFRSAER